MAGALVECGKCGQERCYYEFPKSKKGYLYNRPCLNCLADQQKERRKAFKQACMVYKGGACLCCGYNRCQEALEFHHLDPAEKDFVISAATSTKFENVQDELDKCILVCANCHREIHAGFNVKNL